MNSEFISTVWTRDLLSDMGEVNIDLMQQNIQKLITSLNHVRSQQRDPHMLTEIDNDLSVQRALYDAIPSLCRVIPTITFDDKFAIQGQSEQSKFYLTEAVIRFISGELNRLIQMLPSATN